MLKTIHNILHYGGLDKDVYEKYESCILQQDMESLQPYAIITGLGFLMFAVAGCLIGTIATVNAVIYLATAVLMLLTAALARYVCPRFPLPDGWEDALIYFFIAVIYAEAIVLTVNHPDVPAVTYIGVTLMLPLLFARRPLGMVLMQVISLAIFIMIVVLYKNPGIVATDVWNAVTFTFVSVAAIMVVVPIRISSIAQTQIIKELSECDLLTGLKNRNSYENDCAALAARPLDAVIIYADANGLHELNNTKGHEAGDNMLRAVSETLCEHFGKERSYRIGGDEFVVIYEHANPREIKQRIALAEQRINTRGYSISFGCAAPNAPTEQLDAVIKRAEAAMYLSKSNYYRTDGAGSARR